MGFILYANTINTRSVCTSEQSDQVLSFAMYFRLRFDYVNRKNLISMRQYTGWDGTSMSASDIMALCLEHASILMHGNNM